MKISADFTVIPDAFAKAAPPENCIDGTPIVSFPFYIDELDPSVQFLHWEFVDPDSIPVCGFQWNHWSLANLPVDALMYDFNDSHALAIPADFSRTVSAMIPETVQGRTSAASPRIVFSCSFVRSQDAEGPQRRSGRHHALQRSVSA